MSQELSWCMWGGLEAAGILIMEEQLTISACLMIQTTSAINPEFKVETMFMGQSISPTRDHFPQFMDTMLPALFAMFPCEKQSWWSLLKLSVLLHGLWNTLVILCKHTELTIIIQQCTNALTNKQNPYQVALLSQMAIFLTMFRPTVTACHVLHTILRRNSHVQFVPSKKGPHFIYYMCINPQTEVKMCQYI